MSAYQSSAGGGIGALLRQIQEDKTANPATVPPGTESSAPLRGTVETPVLNPESPGTSRTVSVRPEQVTGPSSAPAVSNITPGQSSIGGTLRIGGVPGPQSSPVDMFNIPSLKQGSLPQSTPTSQIPIIPIGTAVTPPSPVAHFGAGQGTALPPVGSKSYIQTPPTPGTSASAALPYNPETGKTAAETIVNQANSTLNDFSVAVSEKGADSQEAQNALDKLQKFSEQVAPLAANAPDYLKQNIQTLQSNIGALRQSIVEAQAYNYRQIPAWASPEERAAGQAIIDQITQAEQEKAAYEESQRNSGSGNGSPGSLNPTPATTNTPAPTPFTSGGGSVLGAQTSSPAIASRVYPSNFIGPIPPGSIRSRVPNETVSNADISAIENMQPGTGYSKADLTKLLEKQYAKLHSGK